jgi:hypothetical protein
LATRAQTRYFVIGLYLGSAAVAAAIYGTSVVLHDLGVPASAQAGLALSGALAMVGLRAVKPASLPQNGRQVPAWVTETHPAGFMVFGAEMGTGMRTFSPTVLPHVLAFSVLAVTVTQPLTAVAAAAGFATGRALMIPLYRAKTRDGGTYRFAVPLALELAVALAAVGSVGFVAWWRW